MLTTSGYDFEGYDIIEYVGHESAQVVLGTGFLSSLGSSFADVFGTTSSTYEDKLEKAERMCKQKLISKANKSECNAIIGIDVDYTTFTNDIMGVIVSGTFVKVVKKVPEKEFKSFELRRYNFSHPIRCSTACFVNAIKENKIYVCVNGSIYNKISIDAISIKIECTTIFDEKIAIDEITFANIDFVDNTKFNTEYVQVDIDEKIFKVIKNVDILIDKYIVEDKVWKVDLQQDMISDVSESTLRMLRKNNDCDAVVMAYKDAESWTCYCGQTNLRTTNTCACCHREIEMNKLRLVLDNDVSLKEGFIYAAHKDYIEQCANAKEIYEYIKLLGLKDLVLDNEVIPKLEELKEIERLYGNQKESTLKILHQIYECV